MSMKMLRDEDAVGRQAVIVTLTGKDNLCMDCDLKSLNSLGTK